MAQHYRPWEGELNGPRLDLLSRQRRDDDFFDDDFHDNISSVVQITWTAIVGIVIGVIVLIIFISILICYCVCRRKRTYTGRTLYSPAPTTTTTTGTTYQPQPMVPGGYPQQPGYHPVNYPTPQYQSQLPPGQAPPPYPGPPPCGYPQQAPSQPYPMASGGQAWHPQQYKVVSGNYPPPPPEMDQSHLQKASAPPPEY